MGKSDGPRSKFTVALTFTDISKQRAESCKQERWLLN